MGKNQHAKQNWVCHNFYYLEDLVDHLDLDNREKPMFVPLLDGAHALINGMKIGWKRENSVSRYNVGCQCRIFVDPENVLGFTETPAYHYC